MADKEEKKEEKKPAKDDAKPEAEGAEGEGGGGGKSKKKLIILIAAAVLLLGGGGAGLFFSGVLGGKSETAAEGEESAEEGEGEAGDHEAEAEGESKEEASDEHGEEAKDEEHGEASEEEHGEAKDEHGEAKDEHGEKKDDHGGGHGKEGGGKSAGAPGSGIEIIDGPDGKSKLVQLTDFIVNLNSGGKQVSFLKMRIQLEAEKEEDVKAILSHMPRIRDSLIVFLRELRNDDLQGAAGIYRLREEILLRVNKEIYPATVKDVLFNEIIVQ